MNNHTSKYLVSFFLYIFFLSLCVTGLIAKFAFPVSFDCNIDSSFLGFLKNEWVDFHVFIAFIMITLFILHVGLNFSWFISHTKKYFNFYWLFSLSLISFIVVLTLLALWSFFYFLSNDSAGHCFRLPVQVFLIW